MTLKKFEKIILETLDELSPKIKKTTKKVAIVVEDEEPRKSLLGTFQGISETRWGKIGYPDKITLFKKAIENTTNPEAMIKIVLLHEIAHFLGYDERGARGLDRKRLDLIS